MLIQNWTGGEELWEATRLGTMTLGIILWYVISESYTTVFTVAVIHMAVEMLVVLSFRMMAMNVIFCNVRSLYGPVIRAV